MNDIGDISDALRIEQPYLYRYAFTKSIYGPIFTGNHFKIDTMLTNYLFKGENCFNSADFILFFKNTCKVKVRENVKTNISQQLYLMLKDKPSSNIITNDTNFDLVVDEICNNLYDKSIDEICDILSNMSDIEKELMQTQIATSTPYAAFDNNLIGVREDGKAVNFTKQIMDDTSTQYIREYFYADGYDYSKDFLDNATCSETFEQLVGENTLDRTTKIYMERNAAKAIDIQSAARTKITTFKKTFKISIKKTLAKIVTLQQNDLVSAEKLMEKQDLKSIKNIINNQNLTHEEKLAQLKPYGIKYKEVFKERTNPYGISYNSNLEVTNIAKEFCLNRLFVKYSGQIIATTLVAGIVVMLMQSAIQYFDDMFDV